MFSWPSSPRSALAVLFHQDTKKSVIVQPYRFFLAKCFKHQLSFFPGAAREIHECFLKQTPFQFFDMSIFHPATPESPDRKSTRLNSSHRCISYAVFCLKKKKSQQ